MADEDVLERLKGLARREGVSLAEVIRQALEWRARQRPPRPSFIGAAESSEPPFDTAERAGEIEFEPRSWR
jgi:Ribbon-helix-helix protein, copG family